MKALVHPHPNEMMYHDEPKPVPATGEVLIRVEERPLADGVRAFRDLHEGRAAAAKIVLRPR
jgi:hypothetical protein